MAGDSPVALCRPLPYGQRAAPSKEDDGALEEKTDDYATPRTGQRRDVGLAGPVTSVAIGLVRLSPPSPTPSRALHRYPQHCGGMRRQDTATLAAVRPAASWQPHPRAHVQATTKRVTPTTPPSKPLLDGYRARHDAPLDARFSRTAVYSTTLYAIPPHIDKTVRHACKLPPPWPIKGGAVP
jgi:hypothetical protein